MMNELLRRIEGPNLVLRLIEPEDAAYVHGLRTDPTYNRHLSEVHGTVDDQRLWIESYKARETHGTEYYYVIERHTRVRCGLVRLYEINQDNCTWGSWILDHNKPRKAAIESIYLSYMIAFDILKIKYAYFDVRKNNYKALKLYHLLGAKQINIDLDNIYFIYPCERYNADRARYKEIIEGAREI